MFQPREVLEARHYLDHGNPRAAAQALLRARDPNHKDVVRCKHEVAKKLVQVAREEIAKGGVFSAYEALQLAKELVPLNGSDAAFAEEVEQRVRQLRWREEGLSRMKELAEQRFRERCWDDVVRLVDEFSKGLTGETLREAQARLLDLRVRASANAAKRKELMLKVEQALDRGDWVQAQNLMEDELASLVPENDYHHRELRKKIKTVKREQELRETIQRARRAIEQGDLPLALQLWRKAVEQAPEDEEIRQLTHEVAEFERMLQEKGVCVAIRKRDQRFVVNGDWLVVSVPAVILGCGHGQDVQVPLLGPLHSSHARIWRDRQCYQLNPCLNRRQEPCPVYVNGRPIRQEIVTLRSGDVIDLGEPRSNHAVRFQFLQPVGGSATAILLADKESLKRVRTSGRAASHVILLDEAVVFGGKPGPEVHVADGLFPCLFRLRWTEAGLQWDSPDGLVSLSADDGASEAEWQIVYVPSQLELSAREDEVSEAERLAQMFLGTGRKLGVTIKFTKA